MQNTITHKYSQASLRLTGSPEGGSLAQAGPLAAGRWWSVAGQVHIQKVLPLYQVKASQQTAEKERFKQVYACLIDTNTSCSHFIFAFISFICECVLSMHAWV